MSQAASVAVGFTGASQHQRWVLELDPGGEVLWSVALPIHAPSVSGAQDILRAVVTLPDGDIVVVGEVTADDGALDGWIARLAP